MLNLFVTTAAMLVFSLLALAAANNQHNRQLAVRAVVFCAAVCIASLGAWRTQDLPAAGGLVMFAVAWRLREDQEFSMIMLAFGIVGLVSWPLTYDMTNRQQLAAAGLSIFCGLMMKLNMNLRLAGSSERTDYVPISLI